MGLVNIPDPRYIDLAFSEIQGNVGLATIPNPGHLELVVSQVLDNICLANKLDSRHSGPDNPASLRK